MWAELKEAKKKSREIEKEIEVLLKKHESLYKNEIARNQELLKEEINESMSKINELFSEMINFMDEHKRKIDNKSEFLRRHNSRKQSQNSSD